MRIVSVCAANSGRRTTRGLSGRLNSVASTSRIVNRTGRVRGRSKTRNRDRKPGVILSFKRRLQVPRGRVSPRRRNCNRGRCQLRYSTTRPKRNAVVGLPFIKGIRWPLTRDSRRGLKGSSAHARRASRRYGATVGCPGGRVVSRFILCLYGIVRRGEVSSPLFYTVPYATSSEFLSRRIPYALVLSF